MTDGMIELDSENGKAIGLTSDAFHGGTYYWKVKDAVYVSFVHSKRPGAFKESVQKILALKLAVKIPTPLGRMQKIVLKNGYRHTLERFEEIGETADVWVLSPD